MGFVGHDAAQFMRDRMMDSTPFQDNDPQRCRKLAGLTRAQAQQVAAAIDNLRATPPRVHALVSSVAQPLLANIAAALRVDISMTMDPVDVRAMALRSDGLLVNLGMFDTARREGALSAIATGCPFVLDPVKVDRAPERLAFAKALLASRPRVVKGNRAEMAAMPDDDSAVRVTTGPSDVIALKGEKVVLSNGDPMMDRVVATGCAAGLLVAAMICVEQDVLLAATAAVALLGVAGEKAAARSAGPGSFAVALLDAVAALDGKAVVAEISVIDEA